MFSLPTKIPRPPKPAVMGVGTGGDSAYVAVKVTTDLKGKTVSTHGDVYSPSMGKYA